MLGSFHLVDPSERVHLADVGLLPSRDRACIRILNRYDVATTAQLTFLVYRRRQRAQVHLQKLYRYRMLERTALPPIDRGGAPLVFRLSSYGRRRMHYPGLTRFRAGTQLRHSLNAVETVVALARSHLPTGDPFPVQGWLSPTMSANVLDRVIPDAVLRVQLRTGSGILALEIDEGTEHADIIDAKLVNYGWSLASKRGWHVLFVVPHQARVEWIRRRVRWIKHRTPGLQDRGWVATLGDIRRGGLGTVVTPIDPDRERVTLADILRDPRRRELETPVGTDAWLELLASGGGEWPDPVW